MSGNGRLIDNGVSQSAAADRLDSWKEIAAHLRRDESTVRRWEKAGLPVHRHRHRARSAIYAYKSELDAWWNSEAGAPRKTPPEPDTRRLRPAVWIATAALTALASLIVVSRMPMSRAGGSPMPRVSPLTSYSGGVRLPAFSPDGDKVAFSWTGPPAQPNWDIYVKTLGEDQPVRLTTDSAEDMSAAWSPDGRQIAFLRGRDRHVAIYVVNASGDGERKILDVGVGRYFNLQWTGDGRSLVFALKTSAEVPYDLLESMAIFLVAVDTREKRQVTFPRHPESDHRFAVSPDGATLAFLRHGSERGVGIFTMPIAGGEPTHLYTERAWVGHVVWGADGRSLIFTSGREGGNKMFRLPVAGGAPHRVPVAEESAYSPSVAPKGDRLTYVREYFDTDLIRVDLSNANSAPLRVAASARQETAPALSPDGRRLAFFSEQSGRRELWLSGSDGSSPAQLTDFFAWGTDPPSWSPDGQHLVFASGHGPAGSAAGLFVIDADSKHLRRLTADGMYQMPQWSHDGRWIYAAVGAIGSRQIVRMPAAGGRLQGVTSSGVVMPRESPDGQYLYYVKESGGIWRMLTSGGPESAVVPEFHIGEWTNWVPLNDGIYHLKQHNPTHATVEFYQFDSGDRRPVATISGAALWYEGGLTVSPDRRWLVHSQVSRSASDLMLVENFR